MEIKQVINLYIGKIPKVFRIILESIGGLFQLVHPEYYKEIQGIAPIVGLNPKTLLLI